jgi:hypothetical protein
MRDKEYKEIDGHKYLCTMMSVRNAHQTFLTLCSTLGQPVVQAIASGSDDLDGDATRLIMPAISAAVQNLEGEVGDRIVESVFKGVGLVGEKDTGFELVPWDADFERHFKGRLFSMYKVVAWAIEVNYKDFLTGAQALGADKAKDLGKAALSNLLTPISPSGQSYSAKS